MGQNPFEKKKLLMELLIEQIIEFELIGPGPPGCNVHVLQQLVILSKNQKEKSSKGLLFSAKILHEAMYFAFPYLGQITSKFNPRMQDFETCFGL